MAEGSDQVTPIMGADLQNLVALSILCQGYLALWDPTLHPEVRKSLHRGNIGELRSRVQNIDWWKDVFNNLPVERVLKYFDSVGPGTSLLAQTLFGKVPGASVIDLRMVSDCHVEISMEFTRNNPDLRLAVSNVNRQLIEHVKRTPEALYQLDPRRFEEFVAELLSDMGYDVQLTNMTRDGGRDILAWMNLPVGRIMTIVECKRFSKKRPVGLQIVERFLHTIREKDRASCGLIATTSRFSSGAISEARKYDHQLKLKDFDGLREWVAKYGTWHTDGDSSLWLPRPNECVSNDPRVAALSSALSCE